MFMPAGLHLPRHLPRQIERIFRVNKVGHHKKHRRHPKLLQQRKRVFVVVAVAIVKGENDRLLRQWCALVQMPYELIHGDRRVPGVIQGLQMAPEQIGSYRQVPPVHI